MIRGFTHPAIGVLLITSDGSATTIVVAQSWTGDRPEISSGKKLGGGEIISPNQETDDFVGAGLYLSAPDIRASSDNTRLPIDRSMAAFDS